MGLELLNIFKCIKAAVWNPPYSSFYTPVCLTAYPGTAPYAAIAKRVDAFPSLPL